MIFFPVKRFSSLFKVKFIGSNKLKAKNKLVKCTKRCKKVFLRKFDIFRFRNQTSNPIANAKLTQIFVCNIANEKLFYEASEKKEVRVVDVDVFLLRDLSELTCRAEREAQLLESNILH